MNKFDYLMLIGLLVLLLLGVFMIQYYFTTQKNECVKNPLVYGAKQLTKSYGSEFFGWGTFAQRGDALIDLMPPSISFNSTSAIIKKVK